MGGEEVLCLFGSVTGKAESIATQVAKRVFLAFKGRLEHKTLRNMLLMDGSLVLTCLCCRLLTRLASLGGRRPCAAWERWALPTVGNRLNISAHRGQLLFL